jgi:hypothetical protein
MMLLPLKRGRKNVASSPKESALTQHSAMEAASESHSIDGVPVVAAPAAATEIAAVEPIATAETSLNHTERAPRKEDTVLPSSGNVLQTVGYDGSVTGDEAPVIISTRDFMAPSQLPLRVWLLIPFFVWLLGSSLTSRKPDEFSAYWPSGDIHNVAAASSTYATAFVNRTSISKVWRTVVDVEQWGAWSDVKVKRTPQANFTRDYSSKDASSAEIKEETQVDKKGTTSRSRVTSRQPTLQVGDNLELTWHIRNPLREDNSSAPLIEWHYENSTVSQLVPEKRLCWMTAATPSNASSQQWRAIAGKLLSTETCLNMRVVSSINNGLTHASDSTNESGTSSNKKKERGVQSLIGNIFVGPGETVEVIISYSPVGALEPLARLMYHFRATPAPIKALTQDRLEKFVQALKKRTGK